MKTIALLPARGGSKRIPKKNIKDFLGKPIIAYPLHVLAQTKLFDEMIVSSDDEHIMQIAREFGAHTPFKRPAQFSDDYATTRDVIMNAIDTLQLQKEDLICCVYPTSVFLQQDSVIEGYNALQKGFSFSMSVCAFDSPVWRGFKRNEQKGYLDMLYPEHLLTRSQDLEPIYHDAAQFYWGSVQAWQSDIPLFGNQTYGVPLSSLEVQDIDTPLDWRLAEMKYQLTRHDSSAIHE